MPLRWRFGCRFEHAPCNLIWRADVQSADRQVPAFAGLRLDGIIDRHSQLLSASSAQWRHPGDSAINLMSFYASVPTSTLRKAGDWTMRMSVGDGGYFTRCLTVA